MAFLPFLGRILPMISISMTDKSIVSELYDRLEVRRKAMGLNQAELAERLGITPKSYRAIQTGVCKLVTFVSLLRFLELLDNLNQLVPLPVKSPSVAFKEGRRYSRAYSSRAKAAPREETGRASFANNAGKSDSNAKSSLFAGRKKILIKE
jgi:transcriptional regulator with XRE-family HTH domain